jgi:hypothetical protein
VKRLLGRILGFAKSLIVKCMLRVVLVGTALLIIAIWRRMQTNQLIFAFIWVAI